MYGAAADFSGISAEAGLHVDTVLQKTFIQVDEKGTEAAAATALMMAGAGLPPEPKKLIADRPFLYLIRDAESRVILFIGRVAQAAGDWSGPATPARRPSTRVPPAPA
jgi:serpin B